jgi:hypothetical protein
MLRATNKIHCEPAENGPMINVGLDPSEGWTSATVAIRSSRSWTNIAFSISEIDRHPFLRDDEYAH